MSYADTRLISSRGWGQKDPLHDPAPYSQHKQMEYREILKFGCMEDTKISYQAQMTIGYIVKL